MSLPRHQERRKSKIKRIQYKVNKYLKLRGLKVQQSLDKLFGKRPDAGGWRT